MIGVLDMNAQTYIPVSDEQGEELAYVNDTCLQLCPGDSQRAFLPILSHACLSFAKRLVEP